MQSDLESGDQITIHSHQFSVPRLESHLFEANNTRILNRVVFRNETLQQIMQAMSLSRPGKDVSTAGGVSPIVSWVSTS